jgi:hypothetical protein
MLNIQSICHWLQHLEWAQSFRESMLVFPLVEGSHIMALSISVGLVMILDLRLLRIAFRGERVAVIMKQSAGLSLIGFAIMFVTGIILFAAQAEKAYNNRFFLIKLLLLAACGINAVWFQKRYFPHMDEWETADRPPLGARICAVVSMVCWAGVIGCGRTMAYEF